MKCVYYSCYLLGRDRKEKRVNAKDYNCKWHGDAMLTEFRLHKAARCESINPNVSVSEFLLNVYEVLDMPNLKGIEDYHNSYALDGINVFPTSKLYGATNPNDGVYEIDGRYYTIGHGEEITTHPNWQFAFDEVYRENGRYYLCGKNYSK